MRQQKFLVTVKFETDNAETSFGEAISIARGYLQQSEKIYETGTKKRYFTEFFVVGTLADVNQLYFKFHSKLTPESDPTMLLEMSAETVPQVVFRRDCRNLHASPYFPKE